MKKLWLFLSCFAACATAHAQTASMPNAVPLPPDEAYVRVQDGRLVVNGRRERFWAVIGKPYIGSNLLPVDAPAQRAQKIADARRGTDVLQQRFKDLGFNSVRLWRSTTDENYTVGDGSAADDLDYFVAQMGRNGHKIWLAGLNNVGDARPEEVNIVPDPRTATAWQEGVSQGAEANKGRFELRNNLARIWDARLEAIAIRNMTAVATHRNKHNGLRWCDDPTFGVWELSNEEWWIRRMVGGGWQKLPPFFRNQLIARWNGWLLAKYGSDAGIRAAWDSLLPGETLANGSILFAPMAGASDAAASINDANPAAREAVAGLQQKYSRADFAPQRASDVLEFLLELQVAHKQREAAAIKALGKSTRLSPMIFDTGIGYEIQSQFLHQSADAVAHDAYVNGWGPEYQAPDLTNVSDENRRRLMQLDAERISSNSGPWVNWLLKPPGIAQGVPWLEHNRVEGKPYLVYETQIQQPAKYRADFPLRIAALAAIQDWDWICWHYFAPGDDVGTSDRPFDKQLDVTTGSHPQGYHFTFDEVQNSTMRAAAHMFRGGLLQPAPRPTTFVYGRKSLLDPASMDYGGSYGTTGFDMLQTTYQHGVRIKIDPSREEDAVIGPVVSYEQRNTHNPYTPTPQITFDWQRGFLMLDAPAAKSWTGMLARYGDAVKFGGVTLRDVSVQNPPGIYAPSLPDEKYIAFALHSLDGLPLEATRAASISLVSTSFNSGYQIHTLEANKITGTPGTLPVLTVRVGATIEAPALNGMTYVFRDWHMKPLATGTVQNGTLRVPANLPVPVFVVELSR